MSIVAISGSTPWLSTTLIDDLPSLVLLLVTYAMPGVPLTCVSIGVVTVCSTVVASAPVKAAEI